MTEKSRPRFWRRAFWVVIACLVLANMFVAYRQWRVDNLRQDLKRLSVHVSKQYDTEVRDYRRLQAITRWVRDREDFPVSSGDDIVAWVLRGDPTAKRDDQNRADLKNRIRALIYIPPGRHRLRYSFKEVWGEEYASSFEQTAYEPSNHKGWDKNAVTLQLPVGEVHEIEFLIAQNGEETELRVSVKDHDQRTLSLRPGTVLSQRTESYFTKVFPNQHWSERDESNRSAMVWQRSETVRNELLYHSITMGSRREQEKHWDGGFERQRPRREGLRLRCWIESDLPVSASAVAVAAYSDGFLRQKMKTKKIGGGPFYMTDGPLPDVDKMFQPYDGSGNLYYKIPPRDY